MKHNAAYWRALCLERNIMHHILEYIFGEKHNTPHTGVYVKQNALQTGALCLERNIILCILGRNFGLAKIFTPYAEHYVSLQSNT